MSKKKQSTTHLDETGSLSVPHLPNRSHPPSLPHWHMPDFQYRLLKLRLILESLLIRFATLNKLHLTVACLAALTMTAGTYLYLFTRPTQLQMNYSSNTLCAPSLITLPGLNSDTNSSSEYEISYERPINIAGFTLLSRTLCVTPNDAPNPNQNTVAKVSFLGAGFLSKKVKIENHEYRDVATSPSTKEKLLIKRSMAFELDGPDNTFTYQLSGNDKSVVCDSEGNRLDCEVSELALKQSSTYTLKLERKYEGVLVDVPLEAKYTTTDALRIEKSSITRNSLVYSKPANIVLTFNKDVASLEGAKLSGSKTGDLPFTHTISGNQVTVLFSKELPRSEKITLSIKQAEAVDEAILEKSFSIDFTTSGGPKVLATNLTTYGFGQSNAVVITFDSALQASAAQFKITAGNTNIPTLTTISGNTAIVSAVGGLPWCSAFNIQVPNGLVSSFGVGNGVGGTYHGKTICYTTHVVGYSANGRQIIGYKFGSGAENIVFVGGTHGNESSSRNILNSWVDALDAEVTKIPSHRSVYVVPGVNPDGLAIGDRVNANGIDINRNFPANNWKKDVIMPSGGLNKGGGGSAPLSEPESAAIANYILGLSPKLVLTYHATGGLAISNESGNSTQLALNYAASTGYTGLTNSNIADIFSHDITGAFEDWLHDKYGIPAILIELWSYGGNEIGTHKSAMWQMVQH